MFITKCTSLFDIHQTTMLSHCCCHKTLSLLIQGSEPSQSFTDLHKQVVLMFYFTKSNPFRKHKHNL